MNRSLCRSFSSRPLRPLLGRYHVLPYDVFRVQSGPRVSLRDYQVQKKLGRRSYDLHVGPGGIIQPSVGDMFNGPNGCSVRPKGLNLDEIVDTFKGSDTRIYRLPEGLNLPQELVLLHEHTDHHALQCAVTMNIEELNHKLTNLLVNHADMMSRSNRRARNGLLPAGLWIPTKDNTLLKLARLIRRTVAYVPKAYWPLPLIVLSNDILSRTNSPRY